MFPGTVTSVESCPCATVCMSQVHIAVQVYDFVDKHIRHLDGDLCVLREEVNDEREELGLGPDETASGRLGLQLPHAVRTGGHSLGMTASFVQKNGWHCIRVVHMVVCRFTAEHRPQVARHVPVKFDHLLRRAECVYVRGLVGARTCRPDKSAGICRLLEGKHQGLSQTRS